MLGWLEGRIEVIQITFQSLFRGTGRPGIVDSDGLAGASPGRERLYFGVASWRDRSDSSRVQIIFPWSGPAGHRRFCRSGMGQSRARVILFWGGPKGRIEVIQITFKSFSRGAGRPGIVDLAGLAGAAPGESDFVLGWVGGKDRSDSNHFQIISPWNGQAGDRRFCRSGRGSPGRQ